MPPPLILTINGGSSSIKFALFEGEKLSAKGQIERLGTPSARLTTPTTTQSIKAATTAEAVKQIALCISNWTTSHTLTAVAHRVVHGGPKLLKHQPITPKVLAELKRIQPLDLAHLPGEIALIQAFQKTYPNLPHIACFDTAFHYALPQVAQQFPIPKTYFAQGVRRYGFHGISYTFLMQKLAQFDAQAAKGKVILAHLGSGASMAAVSNGKPIDTTMAFTPLAGIMMGTRPGDLDPGLLVYLMREKKMTADALDTFLNKECGLKGVYGKSADMRDITAAMQKGDSHAQNAFDLFCHIARKQIGALAASLNGLDTLVFAGGIGEHAPQVRTAICKNLTHLGIRLSIAANKTSRSIISTPKSKVTVRVIATDEESVMAQTALHLLHSSKP